METTRAYQMPDIDALPDGSGVAVELYGGACTLRLDGESHRVCVRRFHYSSFDSQEEARQAFLDLWREVERLGATEEVKRAAERWVECRG